METKVTRTRNGFTLLEVLIVIGIVGVLSGVAVIGWQGAARRNAARGSIATFQQSVWQGATAAASRGAVVELIQEGRHLVLIDTSNSDRRLRSYELPRGVEIPVDNPILRFLPPGKVDSDSLSSLPEDFTLDTGEGQYRLRISVIGEVISEPLRSDP